jgi:rubrerythrin
MNIRKILEYALEREREGKAFFESNADRLQNAAATQAFKTIAKEEQKHIEFIKAQLDFLDAEPGGKVPASTPSTALGQTEYFADRAGKELIEQTVQEAMVADLPVLRMAYLIERDFSEFYAQAAAQAEGEAQKLLRMLADWETSHERLFKRMHDESFERYAGMPWGG